MSSTPVPTKLSAQIARKTVLERLKNLSQNDREALSTQICERAIEALRDRPIKSIALYRSLPSEVNLSLLEQHFHKAGAQLCYPRVTGKSDFCHVPQPQDKSAWARGSFQVEEPGHHHETIEANSIDCIVVP